MDVWWEQAAQDIIRNIVYTYFFIFWFAVERKDRRTEAMKRVLKRWRKFLFNANPLFHHIASDSCIKA